VHQKTKVKKDKCLQLTLGVIMLLWKDRRYIVPLRVLTLVGVPSYIFLIALI